MNNGLETNKRSIIRPKKSMLLFPKISGFWIHDTVCLNRLGCRNKTPETGRLTQKFISLKLRRPEVQGHVLACLVPGASSWLVHDHLLTAEREHAGSDCVRSGPPSHDLIFLTLKSCTGGRPSTQKFGGTQFSHSTMDTTNVFEENTLEVKLKTCYFMKFD